MIHLPSSPKETMESCMQRLCQTIPLFFSVRHPSPVYHRPASAALVLEKGKRRRKLGGDSVELRLHSWHLIPPKTGRVGRVLSGQDQTGDVPTDARPQISSHHSAFRHPFHASPGRHTNPRQKCKLLLVRVVLPSLTRSIDLRVFTHPWAPGTLETQCFDVVLHLLFSLIHSLQPLLPSHLLPHRGLTPDELFTDTCCC